MINKMTMHHSEFIGYIANIYKPNTYVELGLYHGETLKKVIPHAKKLYGVDINQNNLNNVFFSIIVTPYRFIHGIM